MKYPEILSKKKINNSTETAAFELTSDEGLIKLKVPVYRNKQKIKRSKLMKQIWKKRFFLALVGTITVAICCFTPYFAIILGLIGLSWFIPYLDYLLIPLLVLFIFLTIVLYIKWRLTR